MKTKIPVFALFLIYCVFYYLLNYYMNGFVLTDKLYSESLSAQLTAERVSLLLEKKKQLAWVSYLVIPVFVFIKILAPAFCLFIYSSLYDLSLKWKTCFKIMAEAEVVLVIPLIIRMVWFTFYPPSTIENVSEFSPLSIMFLANADTPKYVIYLFQEFNLFELLYWLMIAIGIKTYLQFPFLKSIGVVAKSYGVGLLLWTIVAIFIILQIS